MGYRAEQLAQGRISGNTLAVTAGMDHQDAEAIKMTMAAFALFLFIDVTEHRQGGSSGAYTDTAFVRDHCEVSRGWEIILPLFNLHPIAFRLVFVGGGEDNVIPHGEGL